MNKIFIFFPKSNNCMVITSLFIWLGIVWNEWNRLNRNLCCVPRTSPTQPHHFIIPPLQTTPMLNHFKMSWSRREVWCWPIGWIIKCCQSKDFDLRRWIASLLSLPTDQLPPDYMCNCIGQILDMDMSLFLLLSEKLPPHLLFFRPPPIPKHRLFKKEEVIGELLKLLDDTSRCHGESMNGEGCTNQCVASLMDTAIHLHIASQSISHKLSCLGGEEEEGADIDSLQHPTIIHLLHALLIHTQIKKGCDCLCTADGMLVFRRLVDEYLSLKSRGHLDERGWMHILSWLMRSRDMSIQLMASRIVQNMHNTRHNEDNILYSDSIFHLSSISHPSLEVVADVVFIHGLYGGATFTWRQRDNLLHPTSQCWPKDWLGVDVPGLRIVAMDYETRLSTRGSYHAHILDVETQAGTLLADLTRAGVGRRPIIWIAHSMGGILLKEILRRASVDATNILEATRGFIFLSVPHRGNPLVTRLSPLMPSPSPQLQHLLRDREWLMELDEWFIGEVEKRELAVLALVEGRSTPLTPLKLRTTIVSQSEMLLVGCGGTVEVMPDADHIGICKPTSKEDATYLRILSFIKRLI